MGAGTFLKERPFATGKQEQKRAFGLDLPLIATVIALLIFGLVMMFSASWDYSLLQYGSPTYMFQHQLQWLGVGLVACAVMACINYHRWRKWIVYGMIGTIILLIVVLFMNEIRLGAVRSLYQGSYQPSELAKLVTVIYLSVWLYAKRNMLNDINLGLVPLGVILGVVGGLIYLQPDLSAAGTVFLMGGILFFLAGDDLKQIVVILLIAALAAWAVVQISVTGHARVAEFMAGLKDPTQASYHVKRSFEAIVNGGWFGVGIGRAQSKLTGLPVPPTDSIFAVIVEELGLFGAVLLIARRAPDMLGTLLATGLVVWIGVEAAINMSVMVGLMPFAGNALPFVSAGGSNLVSSLAAIGILLSISRQRGEITDNDEEEERRSYSAAVDMRRWNRRRRVSRPRRVRSTER